MRGLLIPEAAQTSPNQSVARLAIHVIGPRGIPATAGRPRTSMTAARAHGGADTRKTSCCYDNTAYAKMVDGDIR